MSIPKINSCVFIDKSSIARTKVNVGFYGAYMIRVRFIIVMTLFDKNGETGAEYKFPWATTDQSHARFWQVCDAI